jgi:hypothetical protein
VAGRGGRGALPSLPDSLGKRVCMTGWDTGGAETPASPGGPACSPDSDCCTRGRGKCIGLLWSSHVALPRIAAAMPLGVVDASAERRLRRWLANSAVTLATLWQPLLAPLLAGIASPEIVVAFDLTPHGKRFTILSLGLVSHKRVLPLGWRIMPQQTTWPE